ncbi:MAG: PKD domain-containing protein, partial [Planctomycetes bacterium]|nr:PKD domain-containing protein [Planctomycetota bacterium]
MRKSVLFAALTLASVASAQIPIPAFGSTFTSTLTRGYWFTVPVNCIITGIAVPNEASQPFQVVEIIDLNGTPPPAYPGTVVGTQLFYDNTTAGGSIIPTSIVLQPGQVIGVLGACNDTQASATSYNSYGTPAGPFASSILGNPVTLTRFGTQSGIASNGGNQPCWEEPAGACARVELYIQPASGLFANFTSDVTTGATPLTVNFTDNSYSSDPGGVLAWAWDFDGDSVVDSTLQNPTFVYQNCGTYTVSLTVVDATHGTATETKTDYIVTDVISPSFTFALIAPGVVQFTDTSTPTPSSWAWDFDGDNVIDDTTQNPAHFYPAACTAANVSLTVDNSCSGGPWTTSNAIVIAPSTLAAANAGGNGTTGASAGNIFDVQVTNPDGVKICGVTCRPYNYTGAFTMDLYASDGSYLDLVGGVVRHQVPSAWRLIGTGTATSVGGTTTTAQLTFVPLSSPAYLPKGNFSLAVMMTFQTGSAGVCYTTGTAANWGPFADNNMVISPNPTVAG